MSRAKKLWRNLKEKYHFEYREVDISSSDGEKLVEEQSILSAPATTTDGEVVFVGEPDNEGAAREVRG